jgi:hypothetical protein
MRLRVLAAVAPLVCAAPAYWAFQDAGQQRVPAYYATEAEAKPFPATLDPTGFREPGIRRAYQAARDIPGVLAQQPCYCYCDRMGHKGLQSCHRDTHSAG